MWYYAVRTDRRGPVSQADLEALLREGAVDGGTLVWREGMADWLPASQTELAHAAAQAPVPDPVPYVEGRTSARGVAGWQRPVPTYSPRSLDQLFLRWWISVLVLVVGYALVVGCTYFVHQRPNSSAGYVALMVVSGLLAIVASVTAIVSYCHLVYRMWEQVNDGKARTTPAAAVGLSFVPLFNLYWQFVAVHGLSTELSRVMDGNGIAGTRPNSQIALWYCIVSLGMAYPCLPCFPLLSVTIIVILVAVLPSAVLGLMTYLQHKRAAQAIVAWRQASGGL